MPLAFPMPLCYTGIIKQGSERMKNILFVCHGRIYPA